MKVLAVVAHPDDEVLGMGGTLARHVMEGDKVRVIVLCENSSLRKTGANCFIQAVEAIGELGIPGCEVTFLAYEDQTLDSAPFLDLVRAVQWGWSISEPDLVYTHWSGDLNRDHRITNEVVRLLSRPKNGRPIEVLEAYTLSSTEYSDGQFVPDTWVDIGKTLEQKMNAIDKYKSELQAPPLPRNPSGVYQAARFFGSQVGVEAAEVFRTMRRVR